MFLRGAEFAFSTNHLLISWEKFKNNCGAGVSPDLTDVLKKVASVRLKFSGAAGTTGDFLIQRIGAVGMCHDMIPAGP